MHAARTSKRVGDFALGNAWIDQGKRPEGAAHVQNAERLLRQKVEHNRIAAMSVQKPGQETHNGKAEDRTDIITQPIGGLK
jgi:hypothetical protein